eukprot:CAMPEP_0177170644 /NCGR_PEP_ID=MMETSP0367-20130122/10208_1 /TAXON_ID=447022 ORGANISM="Scrippsiella hangoei-like, Strain SHHI-4" /NCGR_SAMPLE_ID=MMETSP0367 /ASSEMBLY_ACC=CAM_ASM_000362 /LENGTH=73 /DNA_ID=CAMNT_0018616855 /DNA_START=208 /DNA_END=426 /DNA_ORIENTATION=-
MTVPLKPGIAQLPKHCTLKALHTALAAIIISDPYSTPTSRMQPTGVRHAIDLRSGHGFEHSLHEEDDWLGLSF